MDRLFKLKERGTTVTTELLAGITTFLTMVYIVIVNPGVLSEAGMDFHGVFIATVLASIVATLIMGLFSNYPIALAPGMGLNAYFAFSVVGGEGVSWQTALGAVFVAGVIFILLSLTSFRYMLLDAIPSSLKHAITAGIGLFITFIGLQNAKIVVASPATLITMGDLSQPMTLLTIAGLVISLILMAYRVKGFLFIGMIITAIIAVISGQMHLPEKWAALPTGLSATAFQLDIGGVFQNGLYAVIFTFLLITLFDTTGTMLGVAEQAGLLKDNKFPRSRGALLADAIGTTTGALLGTSPTSAYIESSSGVAVGGRTGLTAITVSVLLALTLFFSPTVSVLAGIPAITAPALIIVGFLMMNVLRKIEWSDIEEAFPAFLIVVLMPLTYSIATGIGIGFIVYPILKLIRGKGKEVHPIFYVFAVLFFIQIGFFSH
ncbi:MULTISPECIES: NCS2 family permease [unclassified Paenibacillus]|uniref:NCS2 family permease n=1 Tax=unclassified Paenibacillus TaxID=185978 RepID=UPI0010490661|nr:MULTISPECIES: NCS2 family permease [unclassified Paenibacillus]NIK69165.1 AGZA family xanthine/uracil permease-like MFS transporter [Paenibacillus sp. BK720]TCM92878.1 AGZA family xanthine/uracil permease-like MFS transporter [Paenibacillus sp. BK033]